MSEHPEREPHATSGDLHPGVYIAVIGLAVLFAAGAWGFAGSGYIDLALVVVSGLVLVAVAIPLTIYIVGRRAAGEHDHAVPLREWLSGDLDTWQDRVKSSSAMVEILLPIAAVAVGMVIFAIVLHAVPQAS